MMGAANRGRESRLSWFLLHQNDHKEKETYPKECRGNGSFHTKGNQSLVSTNNGDRLWLQRNKREREREREIGRASCRERV